MSDFVPCDILPDLWDEILRRHWTFLDTEESIEKLEERKKIEGCLKEFLCVVPHDRKFFLPETGHVLRKSVYELPGFTAHNAIIGFEAISQYANNLFTKPWRKEFRVLKTYSGSFQHDIKSNLLDADKMFTAMGYRRFSEDTFVLDGPICPDQVTNVSRDAMAAYVECQIMKHIYAGLAAAGLCCSWQDIFHFREQHVGGTSQCIKELTHILHEQHFRSEKLLNSDNAYSNIARPSQTMNRCNCAVYHQHVQSKITPLPAPCTLHGNINTNSCTLHGHIAATDLICNDDENCLPYPALAHTQQQQTSNTLMTQPHGLDYYDLQTPHRHSFDHRKQCCTAPHNIQSGMQQHLYEAPYDCLDGSISSSASYAAIAATPGGADVNSGGSYNNSYAHPYNAPGNRYPLPYNISSQFNTHYSTNIEEYSNLKNNAMVEKPMRTQPTDYRGQHGGLTIPVRQKAIANTSSMANAASMRHRQSTYPPDQFLIDFDDRAQLTKNEFSAHDYDPKIRKYDQRQIVRPNTNAMYSQPKDSLRHCYEIPSFSSVAAPQQDTHIYSRTMPKASRTRTHVDVGSNGDNFDKWARNTELLQGKMDNSWKLQKRSSISAPQDGRSKHKPMERDISDMASFEPASLDDFVDLGRRESSTVSPSLTPKVQEGVGSFESWNYVFKNLEQSGYSKDLGDREDLLVQSLGLDPLTLSNVSMGNSGDKRRSMHMEAKSARAPQQNAEKSRTLERTASRREADKSASAADQSKSSNGIIVKNTKTSKKPATMSNTKHDSSSQEQVGSNSMSKQPTLVATQLTASPNEWSCSFCTFLNPDTRHICEMCCRSKDISADAAANVSHVTSTCV